MKLRGAVAHPSIIILAAWLDFRLRGSDTPRSCSSRRAAGGSCSIRGSRAIRRRRRTRRSTRRTSSASRTATRITRRTSSPIARATGAPVVAVFELANYFQGKGLKDVIGMGVGGTDRREGAEDFDDAGGALEQHRRGRSGASISASRPGSSSGSRTAARSTSPATRRSSATCG